MSHQLRLTQVCEPRVCQRLPKPLPWSTFQNRTKGFAVTLAPLHMNFLSIGIKRSHYISKEVLIEYQLLRWTIWGKLCKLTILLNSDLHVPNQNSQAISVIIANNEFPLDCALLCTQRNSNASIKWALVVYIIKRKTILDCTSHTWFGFITRLPWIITRRQTTKFHNTTNAITLSVETRHME